MASENVQIVPQPNMGLMKGQSYFEWNFYSEDSSKEVVKIVKYLQANYKIENVIYSLC